MAAVLEFVASLESVGPCPTCGVDFAVPPRFLRARREDKRDFHCPNGHTLSFHESTAERLRRELDAQKKAAEQARYETVAARNARDAALARAEKAETAGRRLKQRAAGGACPCCKRSFTNLRRHVATKHPEFVKT